MVRMNGESSIHTSSVLLLCLDRTMRSIGLILHLVVEVIVEKVVEVVRRRENAAAGTRILSSLWRPPWDFSFVGLGRRLLDEAFTKKDLGNGDWTDRDVTAVGGGRCKMAKDNVW